MSWPFFRTAFLAVGVLASLSLGGCDAIGPPLAHTAMSVERWRSDLATKEIDLPDGTTHQAYLEGGQGDPLVLVHGFGADKDNFTRVARGLTPHYRVIVPDLVGFGDTTHLQDADYHYAAQARRLHAFVQALGLTRVHLGGNSMGGGVVLSYAEQHPQEVASLWLIDAAGIGEAPSSELRRTIETTGANPLMVAKEADYVAMMHFTMSDPPYIPSAVMDVLARARIANQDLERRVFQEIATDSVSGGLPGLTTPTLIVWGEQDRVLDVGTVQILKRALPQAQVIVMPGVGHVPMIERPQETARDYVKFRDALPK